MIADLLTGGRSIRAIAAEIGRAASTVSREIKRNGHSGGRYRPHQAEQTARARSARARPRPIAQDAVLREEVAELLLERWSPEQVAHELQILFAGQPRRWLCTESIYQAIYDPAVGVTRPARRRRRRRLLGVQRRGRLPAMRMIAERPVEALDQVQGGHWGGSDHGRTFQFLLTSSVPVDISRLVVGWSINSTQTTTLVLNALGMATRRRSPDGDLVIHSDRGVQFTSSAFSQKVKDIGIAPSMGAVGSAYDNAMVESFWGRMQVGLFNRKRWTTRIELATAIHDYIELFHNTR